MTNLRQLHRDYPVWHKSETDAFPGQHH